MLQAIRYYFFNPKLWMVHSVMSINSDILLKISTNKVGRLFFTSILQAFIYFFHHKFNVCDLRLLLAYILFKHIGFIEIYLSGLSLIPFNCGTHCYSWIRLASSYLIEECWSFISNLFSLLCYNYFNQDFSLMVFLNIITVQLWWISS